MFCLVNSYLLNSVFFYFIILFFYLSRSVTSLRLYCLAWGDMILEKLISIFPFIRYQEPSRKYTQNLLLHNKNMLFQGKCFLLNMPVLLIMTDKESFFVSLSRLIYRIDWASNSKAHRHSGLILLVIYKRWCWLITSDVKGT